MNIKQLRAAIENNLSAALALSSYAPVGYANTEVQVNENFMAKIDEQLAVITKLKSQLSQVKAA